MGYIADAYLPFLRGTDGGLRLGIFFQLDSSPPLCVWMGVNEIGMQNPFGIVSIDPTGTHFYGAGRLIEIPEFELLINGGADRIEFQLSGLDATALSMIAEGAPPVSGIAGHIGIAPLDTRWQPQSPIIPLWQGTADFMRAASKQDADPTRPRVNVIALSLGSGDTRRADPRLLSFTDAQQKLTSPTDNFFDRVARYVQGLQISWPRF